MFDSIALNVVISLVFIYLLYSLLVTTLNEIIANAFNLRAKTLEKAIRRMLTDNGASAGSTLKQFYDLPIIKYLGEKDTKKPSYLTQKTFSNALVHLCKQVSGVAATATNAQQQVIAGIQQLKNTDPETGKYLETLYNDAGGQIDKFQESAETWFNDTMDRATGWYKRQAQKITFFVALAIAIAFNVDSVGIVKNLSLNPKLATQVVQMADAYAKANKALKTKGKNAADDTAAAKTQIAASVTTDTTAVKTNADSVAVETAADTTVTNTAPTAKADSTANAEENIKAAYANAQKLVAANSDIDKVNSVLGLGWDAASLKCIHLTQLVGWLITALAISLGAPFWFDMLNKLMQLRGSKKIETT